jgi:hypothetical protein
MPKAAERYSNNQPLDFIQNQAPIVSQSTTFGIKITTTRVSWVSHSIQPFLPLLSGCLATMCDMPYMARSKVSICASHLAFSLEPLLFLKKEHSKPKISAFTRRLCLHFNHLRRSDPVHATVSCGQANIL